jgi:hypothetical protein
MNTRAKFGSMVLLMAMLTVSANAQAQTMEEPTAANDPEESVVQYDLAGPRIGATFAPDGTARSQFGWHFENQISPGKYGPSFIIEKVFLFGGMENSQFIPNGTLLFGMRTPSSFEFGVGPSLTYGLHRGVNTGVVAAIGHSFRAGGIRIPVNLAFTGDREGNHRWTLVTGWAIRDRAIEQTSERKEQPKSRWHGGDL